MRSILLTRRGRIFGFSLSVAVALSIPVFSSFADMSATQRTSDSGSFINAKDIVRLRSFPEKLSFADTRPKSVLIYAELKSGVTLPVTDQVETSRLGADLIRFRTDPKQPNRLYLSPLSDKSVGECKVQFKLGAKSISVPVKLAKLTVQKIPTFKNDVLPVLTRAGCNVGGCHGASRGKDGFRLSLFGYDPDGDYYRLRQEHPGRRLNLAVPEASLLLTKATGSVRHSGGAILKSTSEHYQTLLKWIDAGAPFDPPKLATPTEIFIYPTELVLPENPVTVPLSVYAKDSQGRIRDVTDMAVFITSNSHSVALRGALAESKNPGEAFIMARFDKFTVGANVIVRSPNLPPKWNQPEVNFIDKLVNSKLRKLRYEPSKVCSDEDFVRRAYLDIIGKLPTVKEWHEFKNDKASNKRDALIDKLLKRPEFVDIWVLKWAEKLQLRSTRDVSPKAGLGYHNWLRNQIRDNVPVDQMIRNLLTATGGTFANPPTNYYQIERDTLKTAENVAQVFLGMRIQCAQCHNHPFDRWTQDDYYGFAAFFAQIGRKRGKDPREVVVFNRGRGEVRHKTTNKVMAPKFLGGETPNVKGKDRRVVLANWLANQSNQAFSENLANIVWHHFFGVGIVNPVDDNRISNPASNPELLKKLGEVFAKTGFNFREFIKLICQSTTYQRSCETTQTNSDDKRHFSHATLRRIKAEVLLDAISQVTRTNEKFRGLPNGARAVEIADGSNTTHFLRTFGRPKRETVCSCEIKTEPTLSQALHLMNGRTTTRNIRRGKVVADMVKAGKSNQQILDHLYIRCLSRKPTAKESGLLIKALKARKDRVNALNDIFWALLNSREFLFSK